MLRAVLASIVLLAVPAAATAHVGAPETVGGLSAFGAPPPAADGCPSIVDAANFSSAQQLRGLNQVMQDFGQRPTGAPAHAEFIRWIEGRLERIPGISTRALRYGIDRELTTSVSLAAADKGADRLDPLRTAGAVPYSDATGDRGRAGRLVHVPHGTPLSEADVEGRIVVRDAVPGKVPNAAFTALLWWAHDPDVTFAPEEAENYERDYISYLERVADLEAAAEEGAAGVVFVHGFPRRQVRDQYAPYEGRHWDVPGVYVGAGEGERLKRLAAAGGRARIVHRSERKRVVTRMPIATLPGLSEERIVVQSHTDGMNAVWDNGPIAMLALLEHFAKLPKACRPRTLEFAFTTAHLYQRLFRPDAPGRVEHYSDTLDREYDQGKVALVVALEHLGAREYEAVPRPGAAPGRVLVQTGRSEPTGIFMGESPALIAATAEATVRRDVRRSLGLRGADLPGLHFPVHHSFGGEGGPYHMRLIPTVALVAGPWSLYNPAFKMEALDFDLMRGQTLVFGDLLHATAGMPREAIAGGYLPQRSVRELLCASSPDGHGLVDC